MVASISAAFAIYFMQSASLIQDGGKSHERAYENLIFFNVSPN